MGFIKTQFNYTVKINRIEILKWNYNIVKINKIKILNEVTSVKFNKTVET